MNFLSAYAGQIGLLFFFVFFVGAVAWVFRPGSKPGYEAKAMIPLKDEEFHD